MRIHFLLIISFSTFFSCKKNPPHFTQEPKKEAQLFTKIASKDSGINFVNILTESEDFNYFKAVYSYIGGGIAAGDINNDGLIDLYFTSNSFEDKLYLNLGGLKFKDITINANINKNDGFNTGVTMVDVNNDGFLDIYISRSEWSSTTEKSKNLLYLNNGDLTFTEKAESLGIADAYRSIHTTFFDFDNDNDLDAYVSNAPNLKNRSEIVNLNDIHSNPKTLKLKGADRLYENDGTGHFKDISKKAGLLFDIGYGLQPQVGDLNNDGWDDIYVCNDFNYPDLVYINNKNGTFIESRNTLFKHLSLNSMGADIADINNDGFLDILTLDMNPEDYIRSKTNMNMTSIPEFEKMVANNYHHQYMHNMLQINNGNGTFSEIGNMAGIANTDWSWATLLADFDLDGNNDIYVTNGVFRDVTDQDKSVEITKLLRQVGRQPSDKELLKYSQMFPQQKLRNYFFKNLGNFTFQEVSQQWASESPTFSNGATYADLDNDGDLEIIVNNINEPATILKNNAIEQKRGNYLKIKLNGPKENSNGIGSKVIVNFKNGKQQLRELTNVRGFLSSVSNTLHFGFDSTSTIKNIEVLWKNNKKETLNTSLRDTLIELSYTNAKKHVDKAVKTAPIFELQEFNISHEEAYFNDYNKQLLLPYKHSHLGPAVAVADVNGDKINDIFIGGAFQKASKLLLGTPSGIYNETTPRMFIRYKNSEDIAASFFDADNDGDQDLYVGSGSYEFSEDSSLLFDRLYKNDGKGNFNQKFNLPNLKTVSAVVRPFDFDLDGDIDIFIGSKVIPGKYPFSPKSYLLENNNGVFTVKNVLPNKGDIGMINDAQWADLNEDKKPDLIVTGDWMGIKVLTNTGTQFEENEKFNFLSNQKGWWNTLLVDDADGDGDLDIIAGNLGLNTKFHASNSVPFHVYAKDFDANGTQDIILAKNYKGKQVPLRGRTCTSQQIPQLASKIPTFSEFANGDITSVFGKSLESATHFKATEFRSGIFYNNGHNNFSFTPFTNKIQASPINTILFKDFDGDQIKDILLAGSQYHFEIETTRADAGVGCFLKGKSKGGFEWMPNKKTGFFANKDVRHLVSIKNKEENQVLVINNNDSHTLYKAN